MYINGVFAVSGTTSTSYDNITNPLYINADYQGNVGNPNYYSNLRVVSGVALYTTNFTPNSTTPLLPISNTIFLLKGANLAAYQKASLNPLTIGLNILSAYNYSQTVIKNAFLSATSVDPSLSAAVGLSLDSARFSKFSLENSTISAATPIQINTTRNIIEGSYLFNNTNLGSISFIDLSKYQTFIYKESGFAFTNHNKINGNNFTYLPMGIRARDTVLYDTSTSDLVSERLTPITKTKKLYSGSKFIALNSGQSTVVKVNILVSSSYNGNLPRLMLKRNYAAGIYNDTVLASFNPSYGYDNFVQLVGTATSSILGDGIFEFYVDCDGTTGYVCVDTWVAN